MFPIRPFAWPGWLTGFFISGFLLTTQAQPVSRVQGIPLHIHYTDKDSLFKIPGDPLQSAFPSQAEAIAYTEKIPGILRARGWAGASVDSLYYTDSSVHALLYLGPLYKWLYLHTDSVEPAALQASGLASGKNPSGLLNLDQLMQVQQNLLRYYENQGYPFASVQLDSISFPDDQFSARLKVSKGVLYKIDSIHIEGRVKLKKHFLAQYLGIPDGSVYQKEKLNQVDQKLRELPFVLPEQPSDLTMLGSGAILNVYLKPRKNSRADFLLGFLPASGEREKFQLTADVNLNLKNVLAQGETFLLKWQQLQPKSPRLNLGYAQPYLFKSAFGMDFLFDLFRKDSSFLQLHAQLGFQYGFSARQTGKIFLQWQQNNLLPGGVDTQAVKTQKKLPQDADFTGSNIGLQYEYNSTDYRLNPRRGFEIQFQGTTGIKQIRKNNDIINLEEPGFEYASLYDSIRLKTYQLRIRAGINRFFQMGKFNTFKLGVQGGWYQSPEVFRNDLFQIGGFRLLRGFDEESIYATRYAVATAEFRNLISLNSYLFFFADYGLVQNRFQDIRTDQQYLGAGLGLLYETKAGLLNISYALGKRSDVPFNLRAASKIHFGYINYF